MKTTYKIVPELTQSIKELIIDVDIGEVSTVFDFEDIALDWCKTGSYWMCSRGDQPQKNYKDIDFCVLVAPDTLESIVDEDFLFIFTDKLTKLGYYLDQNRYDNTEFVSYRKSYVNLIVTANPHFFKYFKIASFICTKLDLQKKEDRIATFERVKEALDIKRRRITWI